VRFKLRQITNKKAISPIIATLLLILIAIAAGVIVYAYVVGFIGNSTTNSGGTTNTLSIDQLTVSSKTSNALGTAYLRNEGPSSESFNTGFYLKGSVLNLQLDPAIGVSVGSPDYFTSVTGVTLGYTSATQISVSITGLACNAAGALTITGFGITAGGLSSANCPTSATTVTATITLPTGYAITSTFQASVASIAAFPTTPAFQPAAIIIGVPITAGSIAVPINGVIALPLAETGLQVTGTPVGTSQYTNPLTPGSTYTVQITGTDGGSTTASAKST